MASIALVISGGWGSPDIEWNLSPIIKMSGLGENLGPDIFIFRKCSNGFTNIDHHGYNLYKYIFYIKSKGYEKIYLMGHSMGGLIARKAEMFAHRDLDGLITIATPHYGTAMAHLPLGGVSKSVTQMRLNSDFLLELDANPAKVPVYSMACRFDELVWPLNSAIYKDSAKVSVYNMTHVMPIFSTRVASDVLSWVHDTSDQGQAAH